MNTYYIILAAGSGTRVGTIVPKPFMPLGTRSILDVTLDAFDKQRTVVAVPVGHYALGVTNVLGGKTRVESLRRAFARIPECDVVVIHDGARPFVRATQVDAIAEAAWRYGAAGYGLPLVDTPIEIDSEGFMVSRLRRNRWHSSLTPQAFRYQVLADALETIDDNETEILAGCKQVKILSGGNNLVKITYRPDIEIAKLYDRQQKVALVTGSSRGIGYHTAIALHDAGYQVVINSRNERSLRNLASNLGVDHCVADVSEEDDVQRMMSKIHEKYGGLDVLINNAGIGYRGEIAGMDVTEWERVMSANLTGAFLCIKHAVPILHENGIIVNVVSSSVKGGRAGLAAYGASKAGLANLTGVAAQELAPMNVSVFAVAPRRTDTQLRYDMFGREDGLDKPERVARVIRTICCGDMSALSGQVLWIH